MLGKIFGWAEYIGCPPLRLVSLVFFLRLTVYKPLRYRTARGQMCPRGRKDVLDVRDRTGRPPLSIHYMLVCENRLALPHLHGGRRGRKSPCRMQRASEVKNTRTIDIGKFNIARALCNDATARCNYAGAPLTDATTRPISALPTSNRPSSQ